MSVRAVFVMNRISVMATTLISLIFGIVGGYVFSYGEVSGLQLEVSTLRHDLATATMHIYSLNESYNDLQKSYNELQDTYEKANYTRILGVYFSPDGECEAKVIEWIGKANYKLHILIYSFTLDSVGDALVDAQDRGIEVKAVFEKSQISQYSEYWKLRNAGVPVRNDTNSNSMHHKVMIVDDAVVLTGSFNWSQNGQENNNENLVIIDDENVAFNYSKEFQNIWEDSV